MSHKSQSGPVTVTRRFTPVPATPEVERMRLHQALIVMEHRIAGTETWNAANPQLVPRSTDKLYAKRSSLEAKLLLLSPD